MDALQMKNLKLFLFLAEEYDSGKDLAVMGGGWERVL
jgi:hypothetical protein